MHLVDTTLFYSPTSGGVKRYLSAKHAWLAAHTYERTAARFFALLEALASP